VWSLVSDTAPEAASVVVKSGRVVSSGKRWKGLGRATGVFAAGALAWWPRRVTPKAVGFFTDNTLTNFPKPAALF